LFSLSNSRRYGQTYFPAPGSWLLVTGSWQLAKPILSTFTKSQWQAAGSQQPAASSQMQDLILFDKIDKNDIKSV
jgi:hypothetical protein